MSSLEVQARFRDWVDQALSSAVPEEVIAFSFNLYELSPGFDMELIGSSSYDENDSEWACQEEFVARDPVFTISEDSGLSWQGALELAVDLVTKYLAVNSPGSNRLRRSRAVAVGFVDGDLERVWRAS